MQNNNYGKLFLLVALCFFSAIAHAEEKMVFEDQYVVKPVRSSNTSIRALKTHGALSKLGASGFYTLTANSTPREVGISERATLGIRKIAYNRNNKFCRNLLRRKIVKSCSPNYVLNVSDVSSNDPQFSSLWGMKSSYGSHATRGWDISQSASNVVVAIIDTGIDYNHPDLAANVWTNTSEIAGNGIDDDRNGIVDDIHGANFITNSGNAMDDNLHGTHVAGTIGGIGNNGIGVVGVAWNVKMMGLKFLDAHGSGSLANAIKAIDYMVMMKNRGVNIRVANNSWGGGGYAQPLYESIQRAKAAGITFAAAAGNEANDNDAEPSYPAGYLVSNVISVAAIDSSGNLASFSNFGQRTVSIGAPGVAIYSTAPNNAYTTLSGTSMATPHVSGALALLFGQHPEYTPEQAIEHILKSGSDTPSLVTTTRSQRRLDVGRMMYGEEAELPALVDLPASCAYSVSEIPYSTDYAITTTPILMSGDEGGVREVALPFSFPFHREVFDKLYVSLNGVVYFKRSPTAADFSPGSYPPVHSIAALHSDLVSDAAPYGVRITTDSDKVIVEWKMRYFLSRSSGGLLVQLVLFPDGSVKEFLSFENADTLDRVASRYVMGVGAPNFTEGTVNPIDLRSHLAFRYAPACGGLPPTTPRISAIRLTRAQRNIPLMANVDIKGLILGVGSGNVGVKLSVGSRECVSGKSLVLQDGQVRFTARVPRLLRIYKTLKVTVGSRTSTINIGPQAGSKAAAKWKVTRKNFDKECQRMGRSLRIS